VRRHLLHFILSLALFLGAALESPALVRFAKFTPDTTTCYSELIPDDLGRPVIQIGGETAAGDSVHYAIFSDDGFNGTSSGSAGILPASYAYDSIPRSEVTTRPGAERTGSSDTYGKTLYRTGTTDTPYLYVGQFGVQTDPTGLHSMRARYYNPLLMRFINADLEWPRYGAQAEYAFGSSSGCSSDPKICGAVWNA
jgi:RHS repeat-associated protein